MAVSTDRGKTFSASPVPSGFTRYGSFIDSQTWVVSAGIWGDDANSTAAHEVNYNHQDVSLSARLRAGKGGKIQRVGGDEPPVNCSTMDGWPSFLLPPMAASPTRRRSAPPKAPNTTSTASAALAQPAWLWLKATRLVVEPRDLPSPAQIWARPGPRPSTVTSYSVSWPMTSPTTGWMAGAVHARGMTGQFYYTEDGGQTWVLRQTMDNCMPLDLSFSQSGLGVASCVSSSGSTAQAALYA